MSMISGQAGKRRICQVDSRGNAYLFDSLPSILYRHDAHFIHPLQQDLKSVFHNEHNSVSEKRIIRRWILLDGDEVIGRIAASALPDESSQYTKGLIGFFECIHDQDAADALFNTASQWLASMGAGQVEGPVNFGPKNMWWGLLTSGFTSPAYGMNYNPPWYETLFHHHGFTPHEKYFTYQRELANPLLPEFHRSYRRLKRLGDYFFCHGDKRNVAAMADDFHRIYTGCWQSRDDFVPLEKDEVVGFLQKIRLVIDPRLFWFAYYKKKPIAMFIMLPELNFYFSRFQGKITARGIFQLLLRRYFSRNPVCSGIVFGVIPEYQGKGVPLAIVAAASAYLQGAAPYKYIELSGIGDFNKEMRGVMTRLQANCVKTHTTFIKRM